MEPRHVAKLRDEKAGFRPTYEPSKRRLTWPNGAVATTFSAAEPERLRGPQHEAAWCDELGCFVGDTIVETATGGRPIREVMVGDQVWTRWGLRRVIHAGQTRSNAELWCLAIDDGASFSAPGITRFSLKAKASLRCAFCSMEISWLHGIRRRFLARRALVLVQGLLQKPARFLHTNDGATS